MNNFLEQKTSKLKKSISKKIFLNKNINFKNFYNSDCVAIFPELRACFNRIKNIGNTSIFAYSSDICGYTEIKLRQK